MSEDDDSVACEPMSPAAVGLVLVGELLVDELEVELVIGANEIDPPMGSYEMPPVDEDETLEVVEDPREKMGQSSAEVAGSEVAEEKVSCEVEGMSDVLDGADEDVSPVATGLKVDVSVEVGVVVESETLSKVEVDAG